MKYLDKNMESKNLGRILDTDESSRRKMLVEGWRGTGFLYKLEGRDEANMAVLFENQKRQILKENTTTADMAVFDTIAIPMIRRQYSMMVTPNLISVQPLSFPHGVVFYLDYKVSTTKQPIRSDYLGTDNPTGTGGFAHMNGNQFSSTSVYDQFYDNKNYDLSKGRVIKRGWDAATHALAVGESATPTIFNGTANLGATGVMQASVVDFDLSTINGLKEDSLASLFVSVYTGTPGAGTALVYGKDYFVQRVPMDYPVDFNSTELGANLGTSSTLGRAGGPGAGNRVLRLKIVPTREGIGAVQLRLGFREYLNLELYPAFSSEMKMQISRQTIDTEIHKMKTSWTVEFATDLMNYFAIDAEAELTQALAEELAAEKDRMIVRELINGAGHMEIWNADFKNAIDPNPASTVFRGVEGDYNQSLGYAMNAIDGKIRKSTKKGGANWVLISTEGYTKMRNMLTFKPYEDNADNYTFAGGVEAVGKMEHKWDVYVDPNLPADICLMGRKGSTFFDTGYVYAPYVEYMLSPTVIEDQDFNPRKMISSRFGTKMLNNRFYGIVYMRDIERFDPVQPAVGNYVM